MRLKTALQASTTIFVAVAVSIGLVLSLAMRRVERVNQERVNLRDTVLGLFDLNLLTDEYVIHPGERTRVQWQAKHAAVHDRIASSPLSGEHDRRALDGIRTSFAQIGPLFAELIQTSTRRSTGQADSDELKDALVAQLLVESQSVLATTADFFRRKDREFNDARTRTNWLILFLVLFAVAVKAGSSLLLGRSVGASLRRLQEGTQHVARGNLNHRVVVESFHEFQAVAGAFNQMTDDLQASRLALEETLGELETRVDDRTRDLQAANASLHQEVALRRQREQELEAASEAAQAASQAKSEFLANMSHEIRTPMNAVVGLTELVLGTDLAPEQRRYLTLVKGSAASLLQVINDILDFSKIEAGKLDFDEVVFDLRETVERASEMIAFKAHEKGLEVVCHVDPDVPEAFLGDPNRLHQVLGNLLGNAVKFAEKGEVALRVKGPETPVLEGEKCRLRFSVRDTGIGIPRDRMDRLFLAFSQVDGSRTRRHGGTGLGLAIARQIVEKMEGTIGVESEEGVGSTFHVAVSLPVRKSAPGTAGAPCGIVGLRALVVDDNETNRTILREMVTRFQMTAGVAVGGEEGLSLLREASSGEHPYDLVLLDSQMPNMDGFTLAERIRQDPSLHQPTIMMITSSDIKGDAARCRELGIAGYLVKPVKQAELHHSIWKALECDDQAAPASDVLPQAVSPNRPGVRLRVLVAEDNAVNQILVSALLEQRGWKPTMVKNGNEALEALASEAFDVVLMDVQMPEMDGLEATKIIRKREGDSGRHVSIVGLTAHAMKGDRENCLEAGMDDYLAKPVEPDALYAAIERCVTGHGRLAPAADLAGVLRGIRGDRTLLAKLVSTFLEGLPVKLTHLREAVRRTDASGVTEAAHALRGMLLIFRAQPALRLVAELEARGRESRLDGAPALLSELDGEIERLEVLLSEACAPPSLPGG